MVLTLKGFKSTFKYSSILYPHRFSYHCSITQTHKKHLSYPSIISTQQNVDSLLCSSKL